MSQSIDLLLKAVAKELGDNGYCSYVAVEDVLRRRLGPVLEAGARTRHYECEDIWYSCPMAGEELEYRKPEECTCGKAEWDAALKAALEEVQQETKAWPGFRKGRDES